MLRIRLGIWVWCERKFSAREIRLWESSGWLLKPWEMMRFLRQSMKLREEALDQRPWELNIQGMGSEGTAREASGEPSSSGLWKHLVQPLPFRVLLSESCSFAPIGPCFLIFHASVPSLTAFRMYLSNSLKSQLIYPFLWKPSLFSPSHLQS